MKTEYDDKIAELEHRIEELKEELNHVKQLKAEFICPYKIGQIMIGRRKQRAQITEVKPSLRLRGYETWGRNILKDGSSGVVIRELYDDWKPEEVDNG